MGVYWEITTDISGDLVMVKTSGTFRFEQIIRMARETFLAAADNGIDKILGDHREMKPRIASVNIPRIYQELMRNGIAFPGKLAILFSEELRANYDFEYFTLSARNAGLCVELFKDIDVARQWLIA